MDIILMTLETHSPDWTTIIVQSIVTLGVVFGGAGFWGWKQSREQAKRDAQKEEKNYDEKFDKFSEQFTGLSSQINSIESKVDDVSEDMQRLKQDISLLQEANAETVKYREVRDIQDKASSIERGAVIASLKAMIRDRLLDAYERCTTKGYYTIEERETYGKLYECYHGQPFEGNGVMQQLREKMLELPISEEAANAEFKVRYNVFEDCELNRNKKRKESA